MGFAKKLVPFLILVLLIGIVGCGGGTKPASGPGTIQRYEDTPSALTELVNGGIDAVVADSPVVLEYIKNNPQTNLTAFGDARFEQEFYGIAMRQGDKDLHQLVNEGLAKVKANGTYDRIFNKYFGDGADYQVAASNNRLGRTFKVAQDMAYAPFEYINDTGEPEGFDCDLIRAIAAEMGFAVELVNTNWDGIIPSLLAGTSDMIISAMTITEERQQSVTFSDPYFEATQYIAVKKDSPIKSLEDLQGKKVGVQNATTGDFAITDYFDSLK
ncbi:MAG: transporter substrate-binding domain-containing protein [Bacillota bacterium]